MPETNPGIPSDGNRITWDPKNVFTGTARFYARYRPGYPKKVIQIIVESFKLNHKSRVVDLGCGTGQIALKLAPYVAEVIGIDPQEEMLDEGRKSAAHRHLTNISWLTGESSALPSLMKTFGEVDLTVMARSFHWMDREQTLNDLYHLTRHGGGVAIVVDNGPMDSPELPWKKVIKETVTSWLGEERKAGTNGTFTHPPQRHEEFLIKSEFRGFQSIIIRTQNTWTINRIVGFVYSTSFVSIPVLRNKKEPFEADLRQRFAELDPSGKFREPVTTRIMMAWKK